MVEVFAARITRGAMTCGWRGAWCRRAVCLGWLVLLQLSTGSASSGTTQRTRAAARRGRGGGGRLRRKNRGDHRDSEAAAQRHLEMLRWHPARAAARAAPGSGKNEIASPGIYTYHVPGYANVEVPIKYTIRRICAVLKSASRPHSSTVPLPTLASISVHHTVLVQPSSSHDWILGIADIERFLTTWMELERASCRAARYP